MNFPGPINECLAMHEAFRKLGFPPEELYVMPYPNGRVQFVLQRKGEMFAVDIPGLFFPPATFPEVWGQAVDWWNKPPNDTQEKREVYENSRLLNQGTLSLVIALTSRGFYPLDKQPTRQH